MLELNLARFIWRVSLRAVVRPSYLYGCLRRSLENNCSNAPVFDRSRKIKPSVACYYLLSRHEQHKKLRQRNGIKCTNSHPLPAIISLILAVGSSPPAFSTLKGAIALGGSAANDFTNKAPHDLALNRTDLVKPWAPQESDV